LNTLPSITLPKPSHLLPPTAQVLPLAIPNYLMFHKHGSLLHMPLLGWPLHPCPRHLTHSSSFWIQLKIISAQTSWYQELILSSPWTPQYSILGFIIAQSCCDKLLTTIISGLLDPWGKGGGYPFLYLQGLIWCLAFNTLLNIRVRQRL
jgi:hypothetical protein